MVCFYQFGLLFISKRWSYLWLKSFLVIFPWRNEIFEWISQDGKLKSVRVHNMVDGSFIISHVNVGNVEFGAIINIPPEKTQIFVERHVAIYEKHSAVGRFSQQEICPWSSESKSSQNISHCSRTGFRRFEKINFFVFFALIFSKSTNSILQSSSLPSFKYFWIDNRPKISGSYNYTNIGPKIFRKNTIEFNSAWAEL